jgi:protein-S-isoprenylcysteine O-methyltransferase Ste14
MGGKSPEEVSADGWLLPAAGRLVFIAGLLVSALDRSVNQQESFGLTATVVLGGTMLIVGLGLYFASRLYLGRFFSERVKIRPDHRLITEGPYRYIRHPIYLAEMLCFLSIAVIFGSLYGLAIMLVIVPMLLYRIGYEEKVMSAEFGREYDDYARKTWKLIPMLY